MEQTVNTFNIFISIIIAFYKLIKKFDEIIIVCKIINYNVFFISNIHKEKYS